MGDHPSLPGQFRVGVGGTLREDAGRVRKYKYTRLFASQADAKSLLDEAFRRGMGGAAACEWRRWER